MVKGDEKKRVKANSAGEGRGVFIPVSRGQLEEMGVDPEKEIKVSRNVFDTERPTMRLRFYNVEDDE